MCENTSKLTSFLVACCSNECVRCMECVYSLLHHALGMQILAREEEAGPVIMAALSKAAHAVPVPGQLQGD